MQEGAHQERAAAGVLTRRKFLSGSAGTVAGLLILGLSNCSREARDPILEIFRRGYPRAFFFRSPELDLRRGSLSYVEWEKRYLPLNGIMGKVLNEVGDYSDKSNLDFFLRYKQNHPDKLVLLHYSGTGRRVADAALTDFFAGHWLYYKGTTLTRKVGPSQSRVKLHVKDTSVFDLKRAGGVEDDIAIARVGADGKPEWTRTEHVKLKDIKVSKNAILVERGAYGTRLLSFPAGSYLAAHVTSPPKQGDILWNYNLSTTCPRDAQGRSCGEVLVDYLVERLGPGGELESFDGVELDVLGSVVRIASPVEDVDVDTDGEADGGMVDGVNVVNLGVLEFTRALRERLPDKIITADGHKPEESQRSFGDLNGIETEGFPIRLDVGLDHVSKGENILRFWKENSTTPSWSYINFKYEDKMPNRRSRNTFVEPNLSEDQSYKKLRLVLASAQFTDAAFTYTADWTPPETLWREGNAKVEVFDELWRGVDQQPNWLGMPLGPAVHLAAKAPDRFGGQGKDWSQELIERFQGEGLAFARNEAPAIVVKATSPRKTMIFTLPSVEVPNEDLFVPLRLKAEPLEGYPERTGRRVYARARPSGAEGPVREEFTWANGAAFTAMLYFKNVGPGSVDLDFEVEGDQPLTFLSLAAHSATDARYREFEKGVVFANPSMRSYTFDLERLFPGASLRRIQGSENQDPKVNNGQPLGDRLTLGPKDGLFVARSGR